MFDRASPLFECNYLIPTSPEFACGESKDDPTSSPQRGERSNIRTRALLDRTLLHKILLLDLLLDAALGLVGGLSGKLRHLGQLPVF